MSFAEQLQQFVKKITGFKDSITTEEATKTSVILPFFQLLGYDVFDPTTFVPEFVADVGIKRGEKVDYAILQEGKPVIIIEAKSINRNLEKHDSQLFRYFSTTEAKFAILTNGI
ncbi:MAG: type I restriction endonuclease, partial [Butyricicoccus sp.]